ncbi:GyrI-like domain-containing protein [Mycobacterium sp. 236(2023)]|uniref:GyrI-like domain-containing protein n=1 Tax=Mycobacterium sp. 236(2023) TaxID=3038163 RepID=UPI00241512EF|nr:GyrI-like domain-containing protein [Mycobacterium sp. 236(2023)]MDG4663708.1 GyrI-like domain-containing protein [Mycobacterium sp. 236(2023)]
MTTEQPAIENRAPQLYASIGGAVTMDQVSAIADRFPEVFDAVAKHGLEPTGAPFLRYRVIDMDRELRIEACVPIDAPLPADVAVTTDTLPGGRYAVATHRGHFDGLMDATDRLLSWGAEQGLQWDSTPTDRGEEWAGRVEVYDNGPATEPDPANWVTVLAFKLAE